MVFGIVPLALVAFGLLFHDFGLLTAFNAAAFALPVFLAFTYGTRVSFVRSTAKAAGRTPAADALRHPEPIRDPVPEAVQQPLPDVAMEAMPEPVSEPVPEPLPEAAMEASEEVAAVIRPDFARPAGLTSIPAPSSVDEVSDESMPLPDFLRIAEEPERPRRRSRHRLFARRRA
jgi:hypothetical protein